MAKMKVHELAKELDRQSKELVAFLQDKGYEVKAAQSSIEDDAIALVRKHFGDAAREKTAAADIKKESETKEDIKSASQVKTKKETKEERSCLAVTDKGFANSIRKHLLDSE